MDSLFEQKLIKLDASKLPVKTAEEWGEIYSKVDSIRDEIAALTGEQMEKGIEQDSESFASFRKYKVVRSPHGERSGVAVSLMFSNWGNLVSIYFDAELLEKSSLEKFIKYAPGIVRSKGFDPYFWEDFDYPYTGKRFAKYCRWADHERAANPNYKECTWAWRFFSHL